MAHVTSTNADSPSRTSENTTHIRELNVVDVLAEGKRGLTEPGVNYEVNMMDGRRLHVGRVEYVFRDGDVVIARMTSDKAHSVTGRACWFNAKSYFLP